MKAIAPKVGGASALLELKSNATGTTVSGAAKQNASATALTNALTLHAHVVQQVSKKAAAATGTAPHATSHPSKSGQSRDSTFAQQFQQALAISLPLTLPTSSHALKTAQTSSRPTAARTDIAAVKPSGSKDETESTHRSPLQESSSRAAQLFSVEMTKESGAGEMKAAPTVSGPNWLPAEAAHDDQLRLAVSATSMQWLTEGGGVQMQIRGTEVSVRAHGAVGVELARTETELRLSLAQGGLTLREVTAVSRTEQTSNDTNHHSRSDDEQSSNQRRERNDERNDEWT